LPAVTKFIFSALKKQKNVLNAGRQEPRTEENQEPKKEYKKSNFKCSMLIGYLEIWILEFLWFLASWFLGYYFKAINGKHRLIIII
jgi:hypothetical protein